MSENELFKIIEANFTGNAQYIYPWHEFGNYLFNSSLPEKKKKKIAAISQTIIFRWIFVNGKLCILIKILLEFVPKGPNDNNPELFR